MSDWATRRLADVVKLRRGHDLPARARRPGSVPVISSGATEGWHDTAIANGPGVVLGRATNIGRPKWVSGPYWPHNTTLYVEDFLGNEPRWVFHLFETLDLEGYNSGSVQPMLNRNFIADIQVPVPPLEEQRRIAAVLGAFDDLIETNRTLIAQCIELAKKSILRASEGGAPIRVSEVAEVRRGLSYKGAGLADAGIPMVNMGSAAAYGWLKRSGWKYYRGDYKPRHVAHAGDLILTNTEQTWRQEILGWPMLVPADEPDVLFTHHTYLLDFPAQDRWMRLALWAQLYTPALRSAIDGSVRGTTVANLPIDAVQRLEFRLPKAGSAGVEAGETLLHAVWSDELAIADLIRTRDELLPLLMSGRVRVEDVEGVV